MKIRLKPIIITIGILLLTVLILGICFLMLIGLAYSKTFGYTEAQLNDYSVYHKGRSIKVLQPAERSFFGMHMSNAKVKTLDRQGVEYTIKVNLFGHTSGDNFDDVKDDFNLSQFESSKVMHELKALGFESIKIGEILPIRICIWQCHLKWS